MLGSFLRQFLSLFEQNIRLTETDEDKANMRCEAMWSSSLPDSRQHAHFLCLGHKTHAAACKSWMLQDELISSVVHTTKHLATSGANARLKAAVVILARNRFSRDCHSQPPAAQGFRKNILDLFFPLLIKGSAKKRATIQEVFDFFNADWRTPGVLRHHCRGPSCCPTATYSLHKGVALLTTLFTCLKPKIFNKDDWLHWDTSLPYFAIGAALHQLLPDAYQLAFNKDGAQYINESNDSIEMLDLLMAVPEGAENMEPHAWEVPLGVAEMDMDDAMRKRLECAKSLHVSLGFMNHNMLNKIYLMKATLQPQKTLMHQLVHMVSGDWERRQFASLLQEGQRLLRCNALRKSHLPRFFQDSLDIFTSPDRFEAIHETEDFRTRLFQLIWRAGSVVFQLVALPTQSWPFKLFELLEPLPLEAAQNVADGLFRAPHCLMDAWTRKLVSKYDTPGALMSVECKHVLAMVAERLQLTTYGTECLHSSNLRRAKSRTMTHSPDLPHLQHMATASPPWALEPQEIKDKNVAKRGRGRPPKVQHPDQGTREKKRRGGGGSWRAFVLTRLGSQKFTAESIRRLSLEYRALPQQEKDTLSQLGRAGSVLSFFFLFGKSLLGEDGFRGSFAKAEKIEARK